MQQANPAPSLQAEAEAAVPAPLRRLVKFGQMVGQVGNRAVYDGALSAAVLPLRFDHKTWADLMQMQMAVLQRLQNQQRAFVEGVTAIAGEYEQLQQAKTLSKFVLQEYNVFAQFGALLANQMAAYAELMENVQVNYAYWAEQRLSAAGRVDGVEDDAAVAPQPAPGIEPAVGVIGKSAAHVEPLPAVGAATIGAPSEEGAASAPAVADAGAVSAEAVAAAPKRAARARKPR
ncbi:hypothetical protein [Derxia gummosa]|uniref:Phasin domain-containing protein n=1 Tax=Derxia gummosa DSM 723 TaxID=1121388 RepID=A0A8B6XCH4_9BURK|nr:hypothetical protein [Derxia gummosa]